MLNYGAALQDLSQDSILNRLHDFDCEWLRRPNIAMFEMAQTIKDNLPLIEQYIGTVYTHEFIQDLTLAFEPLKDALSG